MIVLHAQLLRLLAQCLFVQRRSSCWRPCFRRPGNTSVPSHALSYLMVGAARSSSSPPIRPIRCSSLPPTLSNMLCSHQDVFLLLIASLSARPIVAFLPVAYTCLPPCLLMCVRLRHNHTYTHTPNKHSQLSQLKLWPSQLT